ncbi:hypothetical protein MNBD_GAMMA01-1332 [hydrothermal vent metagenome]|uniref:Uncharacterized protein n=1 Tax=hydrothermal vent metagenome TaxID=652676 RepID=A0A3B0W5M5_9ZZZZ
MSEPTMLYRPDRVHGATASEQPHRSTGSIYYYQVFSSGDIDNQRKKGWYSCPSKFPKNFKKVAK